MSRQTLLAILITALVFVAVAIALMSVAMAGAFGGFGFCPFCGFGFSPLARALMVAAMVVGGLGVLALVALLFYLLLRAAGPRS